ncbi:hypothetical protein BCR42DRAFT_16731 [Absidia repens]|uniref:DEUBAD domain-containing protein n=1 Tax=Absidia repens TaxID=90262 RepID=A0A1X2J237_9FUNG|nr:hypothetical protein BCR42DRAFT_16731 [Absidia repens]
MRMNLTMIQPTRQYDLKLKQHLTQRLPKISLLLNLNKHNSNHNSKNHSQCLAPQNPSIQNIMNNFDLCWPTFNNNHKSSSSLQLGDVLSTQTLTALLSDPQVCDSLYSCLPDNADQTPAEVQQVAQSPQFQQALHSLSSALQSGQLGPLLTQLGLDASAGNGVEAFLRAIEDQARKKDEDTDAMDQD